MNVFYILKNVGVVGSYFSRPRVNSIFESTLNILPTPQGMLVKAVSKFVRSETLYESTINGMGILPVLLYRLIYVLRFRPLV